MAPAVSKATDEQTHTLTETGTELTLKASDNAASSEALGHDVTEGSRQVTALALRVRCSGSSCQTEKTGNGKDKDVSI